MPMPPVLSRRELLRQCGAGFGSLALSALLAEQAAAESVGDVRGDDPLAPRSPHFTPRARRVIFLFMHGGPSQIDTFDPKPLLTRDHGKPLPFDKPRVVSSETGNLLRSPWKFQQYGESGIPVSELFPHVAGCVDDLCVINSMHCSNSRHGGALLELHTGSDTFVRPSMGSWITYGLGTENHDLPGFVTICPTLTHGGMNNYSSSFLPAVYHGTPLGNASISANDAQIACIENKHIPGHLQRMELDFAQQLNRGKLQQTGPDDALESRINSFELAFRMQAAAPELQDISQETQATRQLYGVDEKPTADFGRQCLMARRFAERGVRFVQVSHSYKWDQHSDLKKSHQRNASEVDKPIAGLLRDLKARGLLNDTLVLWGGEFGRTPKINPNAGRDHYPRVNWCLMAGGGVMPKQLIGGTNKAGTAANDATHISPDDIAATLYHTLGIDPRTEYHTRTGRPAMLVPEGKVISKLFA